MISVIIPLYNKENYIKRAIDSVINQTYQYFEIVVVNDGSTDNGPDIVWAYKDPRIKIIDQSNQGSYIARNRGIVEAKSDLIAFLDADDEWLPEFLTEMVRLIESYPDYHFFACAHTRYQRKWKSLTKNLKLPRVSILGLKEYTQFCLKANTSLVHTDSVVITKKALNSIGGFPAGRQKRGGDLDTWHRLLQKYKCIFLDKTLTKYWDNTDGSISHNEPVLDDTPYVKELLVNLERGMYSQDRAKIIRAYVAFRRSSNLKRVIISGQKRQAMHWIYSILRVDPLNRKAWKWYFFILIPLHLTRFLVKIQHRFAHP